MDSRKARPTQAGGLCRASNVAAGNGAMMNKYLRSKPLFRSMISANWTRSRPMLARRSIVFAMLLAASCAMAQGSGIELRYKLHAGDHLIYREVFEREFNSTDTKFRTRVVLRNHIVAISEAKGNFLVGIQRNRESADLIEYRERGKDKLAEQLPKFNQRTASRPSRFAESNVFSSVGLPQEPIQAVREVNSKFLYAISEIGPLPLAPVQVGSEWNDDRFDLRMRLVRFDSSSGESCAVVKDTGSRKNTRLSYTFCAQSATLRNLQFEIEYLDFDNARVHEKATFDVLDTRNDESPRAWLSDIEVQQGVLDAYLVPRMEVPDRESIVALLRNDLPEVQALALAVLLHNKIVPPQDALTALVNSSNAEVRRIASRYTNKNSKGQSGPCGTFAAGRFGSQKPGTVIRTMSIPGFENTPYIVHVPIDYRGDEPFPLIVYLSGGDGKAFDAALSADDVIRGSKYLALYPHAGADLWWNPGPTEMFRELLTEFLRGFNVDTNRVYLAGFSNGASAALYYGTLWPDRFAAIASLMGAGMDSPRGDKLPLKNITNVPLLLVHGDKDPIIPDSASISTYDGLKAIHPRVIPELHILKSRDHDITLSSDDGYTMPFLERFVRDPFPRSITAVIQDTKYGKHYWVEVLEKSSGAAEFEANILADDTVDIKTKNIRKLKVLLRPELLSAASIHIRINGKLRYSVDSKKDCQMFARSAAKYADPLLAYTNEVVVDISK